MKNITLVHGYAVKWVTFSLGYRKVVNQAFDRKSVHLDKPRGAKECVKKAASESIVLVGSH